jgi:ribosomal protein L35
MVGKSRNRKRRLTGTTPVAGVDQGRLLRMLGQR